MKLYSFEAFSSRVCELTSEVGTRKQAYEIAEEEHVSEYGERKYAGYNSFKVITNYYRKKRKQS